MTRSELLLFLFTQLILEAALTPLDKCGDHLELDSPGYLTSPAFPFEYPPSQRCMWVITAPEPGQKILLNFNPHFYLEDRDCKHDYVEVYNGGDELSPLLGRFCGEIAPSPIISSGNQLLIKFVSDNETQGAGFSVRYEFLQTGANCSRNFTAPGFPNRYPNSLNCTLMIFAPNRSEIVSDFNSFSMESDSEEDPDTTQLLSNLYRYDWLEIWDGLPAAPECSRNFTAPQGVITTPDFPKEYPNNLNCTLMIFAPNTSEIVLEFDSFSMESETMQPQGSLCEYDWLEIWDALPAVGSRIGKYCGKTSLGRVISYTGILSMTIITDSSFTREGFSANYTIHMCGDNLELDSPGYLTSPAFPFEYPPSQRCMWVITAPEPGQKILLNFNPLFNLEDRDCKHDYVEVYNGGDQLSPLLGRFCGEIAPSPIISSGNQLLIKFVSDNETQGAGFSVHYEVSQTAPECSRNFTAPQGVITTPDFPKEYPNNLNCTLMIFAPNTSEIVLEFDSFSMESETMQPQGSLCEYDWLEIWDALPAVGSRIGKYCGKTSLGRVISYTGILSMTIITDSSITREGFSANYTIHKCGDNLELDSPGYLTSPAFPFEYPPSQRCIWVITAPEPGQKILLNFNPLFYLEDRDCKHDYVEVYNGGDQLSPLLGRFCGEIAPSPIISSGNQLLIKFVSDNETQGAGFSVRYEVYQTAPECSRNFTAPQGVITTPDFPNKYPNKLNCTLMIFAPNTSEIVLEFDSFSMESQTMLPQGSLCKYDWLEIWDGLPAVGSHIGRYCGTTSPGQVISYTGILSMTIITDSSFTREGFSANYTIRERSLSSNRSLGNKHKCGDNLELDSPGYLTSPGYPFEYPPSQRCVWVITTPEPGQKILLNFNPLFNLEDRDCKHDYVEVYNGGDQLSPLLGRFCGKITPSPIISSGNQLLIKFVSDNETQEAGFSVRYEVSQTAPECSRNFTAPQGVITTPDFPNKYPNKLNCTLMIFAPNTSEIVLEFDSFSMESETMLPQGSLCKYDWLEIWDGLPAVGIHIGRYCGTTSPGRVISYTGILSMTIITDSTMTREGFSANYTIHKCGDNLELDSPGYLTSPGYPFEYPPSQRCVWVITTPEPGQKILLNFNPLFYLEDRDCKRDYVEVYNGGNQLSPLLGRFCGKIAPSPIISSGNQLLIKFVSDNETQGAGFSVRYEVSQTAPECSRNFTAPQGVITTPDFPKEYPNNLNCTLMIFAPNTSEIVLEFDSFSMEPDTMVALSNLCTYDWLEIWDGLPAVGTHIGKYCGTTSPGRVISYTGFFSMTIITDSSITREGFSANYTIRERSLSSNLSLGNKHKCGDNLELDSPGYLTSPGYPFEYPPSQRCVWVITAPEPGQKILLNFNPLFNLEDRDCKHDYVEAYNGGDQLSPLLGRFCGEIAPSPIISSGNQLLIKFVSDNETQGAGFSVRYKVSQTAPECSRNFTAPQGIITTPDFPNKYPNKLNCTLMIFAPNTSEIVMEFDSFSMESETMLPQGSICKYDWLEIWDGLPAVGTHIGRYCGTTSPGQVISYTGFFSMTIITDSSITGEGFSANYTIRERSLSSNLSLGNKHKCGDHLELDSPGYLTSPAFPFEYPPSQRCVWVITAPEPGQKILLNFNPLFNLEDRDCKHDYVEVYNGGDQLSPLLGRFCGEIAPSPIISSGNQLLIKFVSDNETQGAGFSVRYEVSQTDKCGDNLELDSPGYLTSTAFPFEYPPSQRCVWVITAPEPGQKILLNFNPLFNLEDRDCKHDYVEVYNGGDQLSPLLGRFCGEIAPSPIISSGNQLLIKFVSDNETQGAGFSVRYEVSQTAPECSRNFTAPQGVITTPDFPNKYPDNLNCTLMIFAPNTSEIVLEFDSFSMESETMLPQGSLCKYDWLEIWDGLPAVGIHIGRYCGTTSPGRVISYTGIFSMTIITDSSFTREGFSANYTIHKCGDNLELDSPGYLTSPGYPFEYPPSQRCVWVITAPEPGQKILLNFNPLFNLEDRDCKRDYVEVYNGGNQLSPLLGRFCGMIAPSPIISSSNQLLIKFVSDSETQEAGFSVRYEVSQTDKCGDNLELDSPGYLTSTAFPFEYPPSQRCVWVITAPEPGQKILLNFNPLFNLEDRDCKHDYVEVYNGGDQLSPLLGRFCGEIAPSPIISSGNQLLIKFVSDNETQGAGFSVRYEVSQTAPECSRNFTAPQGVITTPDFPNKYPDNLNCTLMIFAPNTSEIVLEFDSFSMESETMLPQGSLCKYDWLEIWDGLPAVGIHIGRYCGTTSPGRVISYTGIFSMTIITDSSFTREGFSANYTIRERSLSSNRSLGNKHEYKCGDNLELDSPGYLTSPGYPFEYPPSQRCVWVITAPEPGQKILLNFNPLFNLEDRDCKRDYVEVYNGGNQLSPLLGRFCGMIAPSPIISSSNQLLIKFVSDSETQEAGFSVRYEVSQTDKCGDNLELDSPGYLTSTAFPFEYPPSQRCVWVITAPEPGQKILLNFNPLFNLEDRDCKHDYVEVYNGGDQLSPLLGRFCGEIAPSPIISSGNQLLIKFVSDNETQGAGFSVRYEVSQTAPECSRNFTAPQGVITTPDFPNKYPDNLNCTLMIFAPNTSEIVLEFDSFSMESETMLPQGSLCKYDWLEIWDGLPAVGIHIGRYCGTTSPGRVISYTGIFSMTIITDSSFTREGFSANYTIHKCGDNLELDSPGYLTSPGYPFEYPPSQRCVWVITAPEPGQKILLNFNPLFNLEDRDCKRDYVEVYNGGNQLSPLLGRFCGMIAPSPIISSSNQLLIKFVSDSETQEAGFSVRYEVSQTAPECSRNFTAPQGVLTTPDFPKEYPNNLNCTLMIFAPNTSEIVLEFDSFSMESDTMVALSNLCTYDWLEIWDGLPAVGTHIGRYCGTTSPGRVISYTGILSMTIITDSSITREGFSANYTIHKCGNNLELDSPGYLTSPGYPFEYPPSQRCVWVITAPEPGQKILLNFNPHFYLEDRDCKHDYVEVYNGGDQLSPLLGRFCGEIAPSPIISSGNQLLIKFVSDNETQGAGFSVHYEVSQTAPECSRNFTAPQGVLTTPDFPNKYPNKLNCTLMIFAPNTSEIVLEFDSFSMEPDTMVALSNLCTYDWLEIWDGLPAVGTHVGKYCGTTSPGQVISYTGILSMTIITDSSITREGFSANYTIRERSSNPGR